jgi:hypothetical protein
LSAKKVKNSLPGVEVRLAAVFVWRAFLPGWRALNTDFPNYFLIAHLYLQGYPLARVYDWAWLQRKKDHAGLPRRIVGFSPWTLFSVLPLVPLTSMPALTAKRCWLLANLLFLGFTGFLLRDMTRLAWRRIAILVFLALEPLRTNSLYGQYHVLLLLLLTLAAWLYLRGWPTSAGLVLGVGFGLKIYPVFFAFYFLRKKQWRALAGLVDGSFAMAALSLYAFGLEANRAYFTEILPRAMRGENMDPYNVDWNSLTALLHRLLIPEPDLNPHPLFHSPATYALIQPLCQALLFVPFLWLLRSSRADQSREKLEWGAYVAMLLVLSTNTASYHHCVLILTSVLVLDTLMEARRYAQAKAFLVLYILACLPLQRFLTRFSEGWRMLLAFPRL